MSLKTHISIFPLFMFLSPSVKQCPIIQECGENIRTPSLLSAFCTAIFSTFKCFRHGFHSPATIWIYVDMLLPAGVGTVFPQKHQFIFHHIKLQGKCHCLLGGNGSAGYSRSSNDPRIGGSNLAHTWNVRGEVSGVDCSLLHLPIHKWMKRCKVLWGFRKVL